MSEIKVGDTVEYLRHLESQIKSLSAELANRKQRMLWAASPFQYGDVIERDGVRIKCDRVHSWGTHRSELLVNYVEGHKFKKDGAISHMKGRVYNSGFDKWRIIEEAK